MDEVLTLATQKLQDLMQRRKTLKDLLERTEAEIDQIETRIGVIMSNEGMDHFLSKDTVYTPKTVLSVKISDGMMPDLIKAARANGCSDLVKTSINTNSLSAYVRRYANDNDGLIPDWIDGYVSLSSRTKIRITRLA